MGKLNSDKLWHRILRYAAITAIIQLVLGIMLKVTYGPTPLFLIFLLVMSNVAYPWLMQSGISVRLWPTAIVIRTLFMFFIIFVIGKFVHSLKKQYATRRV